MARRPFGALALLIAVAVTLGACGSSSPSDPSSATDGAEVPQGGTIVIGAEEEPGCFDWLGSCASIAWGTWAAQIQTQPMAFRTVVQNDRLVEIPGPVLDGEPTFVESPIETITYKIKPEAVWSDGVDISCADFQYTVEQQQTGKDLWDTTGYVDIDKVACPTPKTVVVTYAKGKTYAQWRNLFSSTVGILPSHLLKGKDRAKELQNGYSWSGGPWFAKWNKGESIELTPNPKFWGAKPHLDKVVFRFQANTAAQFEAFTSHQVDAIYPKAQIEVVEAIESGIPGAKTSYETETGAIEALWFNTARFPFDSKAVRQAFGYAIDRDAIVNKHFGPLGVTKAVNSLNPFIIKDYSDPDAWSRYHLDLDEVDTLMTGDGWAKGDDEIWAKDGKRAEFTIVTTAGDKLRELTEQILQTQLETAGFDMTIENTSEDEMFGELLPTGNYQVSLWGLGLTSISPGLCAVFCSENIPGPENENSGMNTGFVDDPAVDKELRIVDTEINDDARKAAAKKADALLAELNVALPLDPMPDILIWDDKIVGPVTDNPIEGMFWNIDQWGVKQ